ncbi:MAG: hypothetical protein IK081_11290 [Lachnospiraceae bacterium]|nr:hypothetical protein [Lachnospiraceae bacterium]
MRFFILTFFVAAIIFWLVFSYLFSSAFNDKALMESEGDAFFWDEVKAWAILFGAISVPICLGMSLFNHFVVGALKAHGIVLTNLVDAGLVLAILTPLYGIVIRVVYKVVRRVIILCFGSKTGGFWEGILDERQYVKWLSLSMVIGAGALWVIVGDAFSAVCCIALLLSKYTWLDTCWSDLKEIVKGLRSIRIAAVFAFMLIVTCLIATFLSRVPNDTGTYFAYLIGIIAGEVTAIFTASYRYNRLNRKEA